jgi:hypothetical protein
MEVLGIEVGHHAGDVFDHTPTPRARDKSPLRRGVNRMSI